MPGNHAIAGRRNAHCCDLPTCSAKLREYSGRVWEVTYTRAMSRRYDWFVAGTLAIVSVATGIFVFERLIIQAPPLNFDEAAHSLPGYYILRDVRNLDLHAFWGDFNIQTLWPPGFSLLQAPFLAVFGTSDSGARMFSFAMLVATVALSWLVVNEVSPHSGSMAVLIGALASFCAPGWLFTSSWAMQETPVAMVCMVTFFFWARAYNTKSAVWHFATGFSLLFLFVTKYNYAAFALVSIGLVDSVMRLRAIAKYRHAPGSLKTDILSMTCLYLPILIGVPAWFLSGTDIVSSATKWRDFSFFVSNEDSGYALLSEQNLLFYVRATTSWLMAGPVAAIICIVGAVWAVVKTKHPGTALLAVYFVAGFILASLHQLKAERYITPLFPSLWLLFGIGAVDVVQWLAAHVIHQQDMSERAKLVVSAGFLAVSTATMAANGARLEPVWAGATATDLRLVSDHIVAWQEPDNPLLIIGTFGELGPPLFEWRLRPMPQFAKAKEIQYDAPPGDGDAVARVSSWLRQNPTARVSLIQVAPTSPLFRTNDMQAKNLWKQKLATDVDKFPNLKIERQEQFEETGLRISYLVQK